MWLFFLITLRNLSAPNFAVTTAWPRRTKAENTSCPKVVRFLHRSWVRAWAGARFQAPWGEPAPGKMCVCLSSPESGEQRNSFLYLHTLLPRSPLCVCVCHSLFCLTNSDHLSTLYFWLELFYTHMCLSYFGYHNVLLIHLVIAELLVF